VNVKALSQRFEPMRQLSAEVIPIAVKCQRVGTVNISPPSHRRHEVSSRARRLTAWATRWALWRPVWPQRDGAHDDSPASEWEKAEFVFRQ
jgi:hypothetical protein